MSLLPRREDGLYPVTMTGPNSFTLDGEEYSGRPSIAGRKLAEGEKAFAGSALGGKRGLVIMGAANVPRRRRLMPNWQVALTDWLYALGGPGLGRWALSAQPDPNATPSTVWTGTTRFDAYPLGVLSLAAGAKIVTAQMLRTEDDTAWEKLRLHVVGTGAETLDVDLTASPDLVFGYSHLWSDAAGTLVIAHLAPTTQFYRRRFSLFEAITLADLSAANFDLVNVIAGTIATGAHTRQIPTCSGTHLYSSIDVTFATGYPTNGGHVEGWLADVSGTSLARAWQKTPEELLELTQPVVLSWQGQVAQAGNRLLALASGREALWVSGPSEYDLGLATGFDRAPASDSSVVDLENNIFSRSLKAVVALINPATGEVADRYTITATPAAPVTDNGLLQPMEDTLEATMPTDSGVGTPSYVYTWGGRHGQEDTSVQFHDPAQVDDARFSNFPFVDPATDTPFSGPDFEVFAGARIGIQFLPMASANTTMPTKVGTHFRTTDAFVAWPGNGAEVLSRGAISCKSGAAYVAYLKPKAYLFPESDGIQTTNNGLRLQTINAVGPPGYTYGSTIKFLPEVAFFQQRFLAKLNVSDSAITVAWTADLTQLVTASWWRASAEIAPPFGWSGHEFVGGDSSSPLPLGDQIHQISAVGRVVFATIDLHALGAKYQPETRLAILDDSDGTLLHTVGILPSTATLASDVHEPDGPTPDPEEASESWTIDPDASDDHALEHDVLTLDSVSINGVLAESGVDYTYASPNRILINAGPLGADVVVNYTWQPPAPPGAVKYYAGERRYAITSHELRTGASGGTEWAVIFTTLLDRTDDSTLSRTVVVPTSSDLSTAPGATVYSTSPTAAASVAIANGHMLRIEYVGGEWVIQSV